MAHKNISFRYLQEQINRHDFNNLLDRIMTGPRPRIFTYRNQFDFLLFAMINREKSLRGAVCTFNAHQSKLYHLGFRKKVSLSTVSEANSNRSYAPYEELFQTLRYDIEKSRKKEIDSLPMHIIDSTTFTFTDQRIGWAKYNSKVKGLKIHLMLEEESSTPKQAQVTHGKYADAKSMDQFNFNKGSLYVFDRAYLDSKRLIKLHNKGVFFIVRMKSNIIYQTLSCKKIINVENVLEEKQVQFMGDQSQAYNENLRMITILDPRKNESFDVITNNKELTAKEISEFYKRRWAIELFFRWLKQVLGMIHFYGRSENAMKMQIWIALILCLLLWKLHKEPEWSEYSKLDFLRSLKALLFSIPPRNRSAKPPPDKIQKLLFPEFLL